MITFENSYKNKRSGFTHISKLFYEGVELVEVKAHYLNRTWEAYPYQSAMKQAVHKAIENEISAQKEKQQIKRLTQTKKEEIQNNSSLIQELKEKYKTL